LRESLEFSRDFIRRFEALDPPAELQVRHDRSARLNRRAERLTERVADDLAVGEPPREVLPGFLGELLSIARRDNELVWEVGLPECVLPLPGPGAEPA
jgi:hypothetical protein